MTSSKPYLLRAIYEWIEDNELTPYLYINTGVEGLCLPRHLLSESPLVLNISSNACAKLQMSNDAITFQARFSGEAFDVYLPMNAILAIVSRENGEGMSFPSEVVAEEQTIDTDKTPSDSSTQPSNKSKKTSSLKIIK